MFQYSNTAYPETNECIHVLTCIIIMLPVTPYLAAGQRDYRLMKHLLTISTTASKIYAGFFVADCVQF